MSSMPDGVDARARSRCFRDDAKAVSACATKGELVAHLALIALTIAPRPIRSSSAARQEPSRLRSPQATRPMRWLRARPAFAIAVAFRSAPSKIGLPRSARAAETAPPFGDGKTSRGPAGIDARLAGESEYPLPAARLLASRAPFLLAKPERSEAPESAGMTMAPWLSPTSTAVP